MENLPYDCLWLKRLKSLTIVALVAGLSNRTVVLFLLATGDKADMIDRKIGGKGPIRPGAENEIEWCVDARPVLNIHLQRHPAARR